MESYLFIESCYILLYEELSFHLMHVPIRKISYIFFFIVKPWEISYGAVHNASSLQFRDII